MMGSSTLSLPAHFPALTGHDEMNIRHGMHDAPNARQVHLEHEMDDHRVPDSVDPSPLNASVLGIRTLTPT